MTIQHTMSTAGAQAVTYFYNVKLPADATEFDSSPTSVTIGFRALNTGEVSTRGGASWTDRGDWVSELTELDPSRFECQLAVNSGTSPTSGPTLSPNWHTLDNSRSWTFSATPGEFNSGNWTLTVREIADTSNTDSMTLDWDTEDGS